MAIVRCQVQIPRDTTLPEDVTVNTWHFDTESPGGTMAEFDAIHAALTTFYQTIDDSLLSSVVASPAKTKMYNLDLPKPRAPIREGEIALVPSASAQCPEEAALCLSFQGDKISGVLQRRRRGRVYIGPMPATVLESQPVAGRVRPTAAAINTLVTAAGALLTASNASPLWRWIVWSELNAPPGGPGGATPVTNGWVDNALDTQRRRGPAATTRQTFVT